MRKVLVFIILLASLSLSAQDDNFFNRWDEIGNGLDKASVEMPAMPGGHGEHGDINMPLGSGLIILTALGAGYAIKKSKRQQP